MDNRSETLFSKDTLEMVKQRTLEDVRRDIKEENPLYGMQGSFEQKLLQKYKLPVATITDRKNRVQGDKIEHVIHFEGGNGGFFHYSPTKKARLVRPRGYAISDAVYLYFHNTNDAASLKAKIKEEDEALTECYDLVRAEVQEFNDALPGFIEKAISENNARLQREKELEEELNS